MKYEKNEKQKKGRTAGMANGLPVAQAVMVTIHMTLMGALG